MKLQGNYLPPPADLKNLKLSPDLHRRLKTTAAAQGKGINAFGEELLEAALEPVLSGGTVPGCPPGNSQETVKNDMLSDLAPELTGAERGFLSECLRIYRSQFGRPLQENVTFFGIGLAAVEAIAEMRVSGGRANPDADALSPSERRAFAIADHATNEADLLKAAADDVVAELRRARAGDTGAAGGAKSRRKSSPGKTGSGS